MQSDEERKQSNEERKPTAGTAGRPLSDRRSPETAQPEPESDFAEENTPSETDPPNQDLQSHGDEPPKRPTRTEGGPWRPV